MGSSVRPCRYGHLRGMFLSPGILLERCTSNSRVGRHTGPWSELMDAELSRTVSAPSVAHTIAHPEMQCRRAIMSNGADIPLLA